MSPQRKIILVVAVAVACLGAVEGVKWFIRGRTWSSPSACVNNLRMIDSAKDGWAFEGHKPTNAVPTWADVLPYLRNKKPTCPSGGTYTLGTQFERSRCSIPGHSLAP